MVFLPPDEAGAGGVRARSSRRWSREEGQTVLGWRDVPTDDVHAWARAPGPASRSSGRSSSAAARAARRRAELRAEALRDPAPGGEEDLALGHPGPDATSTSRASPARPSSTRGCSTPASSASSTWTCPGAEVASAIGDGPLALLDQHLPVLVARPPLPLHLAQRRDQHAARQHQLDARAPAHDARRRCSATTCRRSSPSSTPRAPTRRCSTTCWSSCTLAGRELPHAMMMMVPEPWSRHEIDEPRARRPSTSTTPA